MLQVGLFIILVVLHMFIRGTVYFNYIVLALTLSWCLYSCVKPIVIDEELIGDYISGLLGIGLFILILLIAEPTLVAYITPLLLVPIINIVRIKLKI